MSPNKGVYFLANDTVLDLSISFLNSFRLHNPNLPLCLIPYDSNIAKLTALQELYRFEIYQSQATLSRCDAISRNFHPQNVGEFRKIAAWSGNFDEFVYVDIDTILLRPVDFVFDYLRQFDVLNSHSNIAVSRRHTWKDSILDAGILTPAEIDYSANMGFIASKRGAITFADIERLMPEALKIKPHMELKCADQPYLNFLVLKSGVTFTSLHALREFGGLASLPHECWAGDPNWVLSDEGEWRYVGIEKEVLFVHWAGQWAPSKIEKRFHAALRRIGLNPPGVRRNMPLKQLWRQYRNLRICVGPEAPGAALLLASR